MSSILSFWSGIFLMLLVVFVTLKSSIFEVKLNEMPTIITINNNGSIRIEGDDFIIQDSAGNTFDLNGRTKVALCRCGKSEKMPFCDGKHKGEFVSEVSAYALPPVTPKPENPAC